MRGSFSSQDSAWQLESQPSKSFVLLSSHCSPGSFTPLPQTLPPGRVVDVVVVPGSDVLDVVGTFDVVLVTEELVVVGMVLMVVEVTVDDVLLVVGTGTVVVGARVLDVVGGAVLVVGTGHWHWLSHASPEEQTPVLPGGSHCSPAPTTMSPHWTLQPVSPALQQLVQVFFRLLQRWFPCRCVAFAWLMHCFFVAPVHAFLSALNCRLTALAHARCSLVHVFVHALLVAGFFFAALGPGTRRRAIASAVARTGTVRQRLDSAASR